MDRPVSVSISLAHDLTADDVAFVAARLNLALSEAQLRDLACRVADDIFLRGEPAQVDSVGILNA